MKIPEVKRQKFNELFNKGLKRPNDIIPYINKYYQRWKNNKETNKIRKKINQVSLIWHFCTPKSASSYLEYLLKLNNRKHVSSIPYHCDRQQLADFSFLYNQIQEQKLKNRKYFSVSHQHTIYDSFLEKYISKKHIVIIQFRNIYKTVLSLKDYIISENIANNNPFARWDTKNYEDKDILKLIIFNYVPFHVNFIKTWVESKLRGKKIFINYESFIKNEKYYLEQIFIGDEKKNLKIPKIEKIKKESIKFNIGTKRENILTIDEKKLIDDIVNIHIKHSDPIINSLIYENSHTQTMI